MSWFDTILKPIMWCVAWIMYGAHKFFSLVHINNSVSWVLSIVVLVVVMRCIMIPLFVKQIKSSRNMQLIQPEIQKLQRKYKGKTDPVSRRRQQEEMMELYRKAGSNPLSGCWPILAQSPLFFALFRVLYSLGQVADGTYKNGTVKSIGPIDAKVAADVVDSNVFGAPLSATFMNPATWAGAPAVTVRVVTVVLIVLMSATTFTTQRQLTMKNMPQSAMDNPMFRTQKIMLFMMPVIFAVSGVNFPIGVLIYWLTTNLWSMGQQFIVIRNMPAPGSEAERRMQARKAKKHPEQLDKDGAGGSSEASPAAPAGQRQQPKRTTRSQRKSSASGPETAGKAPAAAAQGKAAPAKPAKAAEPTEPAAPAEAETKAATPTPPSKTSGQRTQPKNTSRKQRKK
ncbi:MAG: membrane protein insertase YidC [Bifidobacteriaceae bacterium]|jgi:YidC/Oxa1 family membrane protein insertase|nr:membrane protein insertase YidC [Bifidobacteriaceae bacterium]